MKAKILVVEDNDDNRALVVKVLTRCGHELLQASGGEEALDLAEKKSPDLVLMDLNLGGISGFETARRFKSDPRLRDIPIVALTAYAMVGDRERALKSGCDGYLSKPIDVRKLGEQVEGFLKEKNG